MIVWARDAEGVERWMARGRCMRPVVVEKDKREWIDEEPVGCMWLRPATAEEIEEGTKA